MEAHQETHALLIWSYYVRLIGTVSLNQRYYFDVIYNTKFVALIAWSSFVLSFEVNVIGKVNFYLKCFCYSMFNECVGFT